MVISNFGGIQNTFYNDQNQNLLITCKKIMISNYWYN